MNVCHIGKRVALGIFCFWPMIGGSSSAQKPSSGEIRGHVVDPAGAVIKGASVFVRKNIPSEENVRLLAHTDVHGDFALALPEGGYDVLITSPGFAASVETVPVFRGKARKVDWNLKVLGCDFPGVNCDTFN